MAPPPSNAPSRAAASAPFQLAKKGDARGSAAAVVAMLLLALDLGLRDHRDVLRANPGGGAGGDGAQRLLGIGQSELRLAFEIVALGRGQRRPPLVAFAIVDDAELIPGVGIGIISS